VGTRSSCCPFTSSRLTVDGILQEKCPDRPQRSTEFRRLFGWAGDERQLFFIHLGAYRKHVVGPLNFPQIQKRQSRFRKGQDRATGSLSLYRRRRAIAVKLHGALFTAAVALHAGIRALIPIYLRYNCYLAAGYVDADQQRFSPANPVKFGGIFSASPSCTTASVKQRLHRQTDSSQTREASNITAPCRFFAWTNERRLSFF